ncbi:MAG: DNA polymerase I [Candidatus Omnitrophota bacterium]|nr:DNA polymerase I [Candidatus Omnitrophota bacterium]
MRRDKLFLIDGNSFCYRAFYAIRNLSTSKGQPTNAVYGFISMINKIIKEEKPESLAIAFDLKGPTFRHEKFKDYKIHRKPMPDELIEQMPIIKEVVKGYNIPLFEMQGYEADDVLATLAKKAEKKEYEVYIATGDKDMLQLVNSCIKVYNVHKDGLIYDKEKVKERYGVGPDKIVDLIALMGDSSDNIPGVAGIGEVTARQLIEKFGSLDKVLSGTDKIESESLRRKLKESMDQARLSKELATVDTDVPLDIDFDELKLKEPDRDRLYELFTELEFKSLMKNFEPVGQQIGGKYTLISDEDELAKIIKELVKCREFALDFETTGTDPLTCEPVGVSFCWKEAQAYYVPIKDEAGGFEAGYLLSKLKPVIEDAKKIKIGQNIKFEKALLAVNGVELNGTLFDTMVASYLLNPSKLNHNLGDILQEYLQLRKTPISDLLGKGKGKITMKEVDTETIKNYCCQDSDAAFRLKQVLEPQLGEKDLSELFYEVEMPLVDCLTDMELAGVAIDLDFLSAMSKDLDKQLRVLTSEIHEIAGSEFNINSPKQLGEVLFGKLGLPVVKKTKTGPSTDVEVLEVLSAVHALPASLLKYRELSKLKSTYVDALPELINPKTGRVHTSFNQTVTATGRLSSSDPNLQNIPVKTEAGRQIRKAFIAGRKDCVIMSADYSQIELRVLAHFSGDKELVEAFKEDRDIHAHTASLVFGVDEAAVTPEMRSIAKTVNFGIVYGMSPYGLARDLKIEPSKAKEFIDSYFERYGRIKVYFEEMIEEAREKGYVTTILNRRRYIPEINSHNNSLRQFAERTAVNTPIQGSAADLIKVAMINIHRTIKEEGLESRMILQVHDELVFEVRKDEVEQMRKIVKAKMEQAAKLKVPIKVQIKVGKNWLEAA